MVGSFNATVGFGGAALTHVVDSNDIFLAKFDIMGQHLWSKRFGGSSDDEAIKVETARPATFMSPDLLGSTDLGDGNVPNQGGADVFIAKYSADGALQWKHTGRKRRRSGPNVDCAGCVGKCVSRRALRKFTRPWRRPHGQRRRPGHVRRQVHLLRSISVAATLRRPGYQAMYNITADVMDNLYLIGVFGGTINFGAGNMTSIGSANLALAKFNSSGQCQWSKRFGLGARLDEGYVATDSAGNLYITGAYLCCLDFGGGFMFENGGLDDIYLAKFDASGNHLWSKDYGDNNTDLVRGLAIDANDNLYLYGMFRGTVDFGGGPIPEDSTSFWTPFLAEIDAFPAITSGAADSRRSSWTRRVSA